MPKSESTQSTSTPPAWPVTPHLDDSRTPPLPPPAFSAAQGHSRSRTTIDIPPLLPRATSHSPTRSSTFLPFFSTSRSPSPKRASPSDAAEFAVDQAGVDETSRRPRPGKVERLASWFEGSSEPVNIGLVASPKNEQEERNETIETLFASSQESVATPTFRPVMSSANNSTSRFNFFRRPSTVHLPSTDELESLNVQDTLFPNGPVADFSPAAFRSLQHNAEGALRMFQQAYRDVLVANRRIVSAKNIQADELEASQTRNEHLKAQLLEMADRSSEQEKRLASLQAENGRLRANEADLRSVRLVTDHTSSDESQKPSHEQMRTRRNRLSDVSTTDSIVSASTNPSMPPSVFSHNENDAEGYTRSPSTSIGCPSPVIKHSGPVVKDARVITPHIQRIPEHLHSLTTDVRFAVHECQNCHGVRAHEAWDVIGMMKAESTALKQRIEELEQAHDTAFDLCTWQPDELHDMNTKYGSYLGGRAGLSTMDAELLRDEPVMKGCIV